LAITGGSIVRLDFSPGYSAIQTCTAGAFMVLVVRKLQLSFKIVIFHTELSFLAVSQIYFTCQGRVLCSRFFTVDVNNYVIHRRKIINIL